MTMHSAQPDPLIAAELDRVAQLLRSLGEPSRLEILNHLRTGEHRVGELAEHLGLAQSTTSAHLAVLREAGVVSVRSDGRASVYALTAPDELAKLIAATVGLLGVGPVRVHAEAEAGHRTRRPVATSHRHPREVQ